MILIGSRPKIYLGTNAEKICKVQRVSKINEVAYSFCTFRSHEVTRDREFQSAILYLFGTH